MKETKQTLQELICNFARQKGKNTLVVLDDLLSYIVGFFDPNGEALDGWGYDKQSNVKFHEMMVTYFAEMDERLKHLEWCDLWGDLYMSLITKGDSKGQFFTPANICDMMAKVSIDEDVINGCGIQTTFGKRISVNDPASGSGRNLLSAAVEITKLTNRKPYLIAEDIESICCKMAAVNIAMHGWYGEVVCHNTLEEPDKMRFGYIINETMYPFPTNVPSIRKCTNPKSFVSCAIWVKDKETTTVNAKTHHNANLGAKLGANKSKQLKIF